MMERRTVRKYNSRSEPLLPYQHEANRRRRGGVCSLHRVVATVFVAALIGVVTVAFLGVPGFVQPGFSRTKKAPTQQTNDIDAHAAMWHEYEGEDAEERAEQAVLDQQIRLEQERRQLSERLAAEAAVKKGAGHASEGVGDQLGQRAAQERAAAGLTTLAREQEAKQQVQPKADKNPSELIASIAELQKQVLSSAPDVKQHAIETEQVQPKAVQQQQQQHQQHQAADAQQHVDMAMPAPTPAPTDAAHAVQDVAAVHPELISKDGAQAGQQPMPLVATGIYALTARDENDQDVSLSKFTGMVTIVVNVASQCGYTTSNYEGLVRLYDQYKDRGFDVLAFPCNQFGNQEPGSCSEVQHFAAEKFKATFPIFNKVDVNGANTHPVFKFLKDHTPLGHGGGADVEWNFAKWVVNKKGYPVVRYPSTYDAGTEQALKGYVLKQKWIEYELSH